MKSVQFKDFDLLNGLTEEELILFQKCGSQMEYEGNAVVFKEGVTGDSLYLILSGAVKISKQIEDGSNETLAIISEKSHFGEMALIDSETRSATATTITKTTLFRVKRFDFMELMDEKPHLSISVLMGIATICVRRLRAANNRFGDITINSKLVLDEVEKMKTSIISLISHELRTPLTVIKGSAKILESETLPKASKARFLEKINNQSDKLKAIIDNLISLSVVHYRSAALEPEEVDVGRLIAKLAETQKDTAAQKKISLRLHVVEGCPLVWVDKEGISKVVYNLLENAFKFTPENGKVTVSVKFESSPEGASNQSLIVSVEDTGIGIPAKITNMVFEPFFQQENYLTREHGGTGIGLSVAKNIITSHGGAIWVVSKEGAGSTFVFTLPVNSGDTIGIGE